MVIFGAGGDLTKRLLMPALYNLAGSDLLDEGLQIIGVDHTDQRQVGEMIAFGDKLRADDQVDVARFHGLDELCCFRRR